MKRWVYFALIVATLAGVAIAESMPGSVWEVLLVPLAVAGIAIWRNSVRTETRDHEYRRTYEASPTATYGALCGALGNLDYKVTANDPEAGRLQFRGGTLGPWLGRLGVNGTASVHRVADRASEIAITGHASPTQKHGLGLFIYPEGIDARAARIFDQVAATVITYATVEDALTQPPGDVWREGT